MGEAFVVSKPSAAALRALNHAPAIERLRSLGTRAATTLGELVTEMGPAYGAVFVRIDCSPEHGIELITQSDMFGAEPEGRVIRRDSMAKPERHLVHRWQVLIAGAGTLGETELYGRAIIADGRLADRYVGPHAMVLTFASPESDESLFTYAYLCSRVGLRAIRTCSFGTKILGLRKDLLAGLPVPRAPKPVQARVAALVRACVEHRETSVRQLQAARDALHELPEMRAAHEVCVERTAHAVTWGGPFPTLGAWNFASAGEAIHDLKRKWSTRFGDVLAPNGLYYGGRSARIPCSPPHGVDFVSQRDAFSIRPIPRRVLLPGIPPERVFAPEGSLVIAGRGTLGEGELFGRAAYVTGTLARLGLTEDLLRMVLHPKDAPIAYAFLSTIVGLRLLRTTAVGTKILNLRADLVRQLPFPELPEALRKRVTGHVQTSCQARAAADHAEEEAIRIVEEEVLPSWLG